MADKWLNEYVKKEMNKPKVLTELLNKGFKYFGNQENNKIYKLNDEIIVYNSHKDKIIKSWNIEI